MQALTRQRGQSAHILLAKCLFVCQNVLHQFLLSPSVVGDQGHKCHRAFAFTFRHGLMDACSTHNRALSRAVMAKNVRLIHIYAKQFLAPSLSILSDQIYYFPNSACLQKWKSDAQSQSQDQSDWPSRHAKSLYVNAQETY